MFRNRNDNIKLRLMEEADLPFLLEVRNHSSTRSQLHDMRRFELSDAVEWWDRTHPVFYVIEHRGEPVGYMRTSSWDNRNRHVMIGADVHHEHRRRGYAFAAYQHLLDQLFLTEIHKVSLEVLATNQPAITLYENLGFVREGVKRDDVVRGSKYVDSVIMSILDREWWGRDASQGI